MQILKKIIVYIPKNDIYSKVLNISGKLAYYIIKGEGLFKNKRFLLIKCSKYAYQECEFLLNIKPQLRMFWSNS